MVCKWGLVPEGTETNNGMFPFLQGLNKLEAIAKLGTIHALSTSQKAGLLPMFRSILKNEGKICQGPR